MRITHEWAQKIVNRVMATVACNINIMDAEGRIVGTGDPKRLNTIHEAAREVLRRRRTVEISEGEERRWPGVKPGVNMPIELEGNVIGVVGITGQPDRVRPLAALVKMAVELMIQERVWHERHRVEAEMRERLLRRWLMQPGLTTQKEWVSLYQTYGIDIRLPRAVYVLDAVDEPVSVEGRLSSVRNLLEREDQVTIGHSGEVVVLRVMRGERNGEALRSFADRLYRACCGDGRDVYVVVTEAPAGEVAPAYREASRIAGLLKRVGEPGGVYRAEEVQLLRLVDDLPLDKKRELIARTVGPLVSRPERDEWIHTLRVFFRCHLNVSEAARQLHVHRNTLLYRLARIREVTGRCSQQFPSAVELYAGLLAHLLDAPPSSPSGS